MSELISIALLVIFMIAFAIVYSTPCWIKGRFYCSFGYFDFDGCFVWVINRFGWRL